MLPYHLYPCLDKDKNSGGKCHHYILILLFHCTHFYQLLKIHRAKWKQSKLTATRTRPPWRIPALAGCGQARAAQQSRARGGNTARADRRSLEPFREQSLAAFLCLLRVFQSGPLSAAVLILCRDRGSWWSCQDWSHRGTWWGSASSFKSHLELSSHPRGGAEHLHPRLSNTHLLFRICCASTEHCTATAPLLTQHQRISCCTVKKDPKRNWSLLNKDGNTKFEKNYRF